MFDGFRCLAYLQQESLREITHSPPSADFGKYFVTSHLCVEGSDETFMSAADMNTIIEKYKHLSHYLEDQAEVQIQQVLPVINKGSANLSVNGLSELIKYANPPPSVLSCLEATLMLLGYDPLPWPEVQAHIRQHGLVPSKTSQ